MIIIVNKQTYKNRFLNFRTENTNFFMNRLNKCFSEETGGGQKRALKKAVIVKKTIFHFLRVK